MGEMRDLAHRLRVDAHAIWLASRDPRVPIQARIWGWLVAAYALSPIDLIPDFVPFVGMLDDAVLVPFGIWIFMKLVPAPIFAEHRATAEAASQRPISRAGAVIIVLVWLVAVGLIGLYVYSWRFY